jgi:phosphatidate phosphatase APP1
MGSFHLLSDLDDTIKISHSASPLVTVFRGLFRRSAFAGMSTLYRELIVTHPENQFTVLSSSPPAIRKKIQLFLAENDFPEARLILRDWFRQKSVLRYKLKSMVEICEAPNSPQLILVGDDTEYDPEVFARIRKKFPHLILAAYVRCVRGRALPPGMEGFFTAFEIACAELKAGRLSSEQVFRVGEAVLAAEGYGRLIPKFSLKPKHGFGPLNESLEPALAGLWEKIRTKVLSIPRRREEK